MKISPVHLGVLRAAALRRLGINHLPTRSPYQERCVCGYTLQASNPFGKSLDYRSRSMLGQTGRQNPLAPHLSEKAPPDFDQD